MTTYTLAIADTMLLATVPDGADVAAAVAELAASARINVPEYICEAGCTLTDEEPDDSRTIIWASGNGGAVTDETGMDWLFAVRNHQEG